MPKPGRPKKKDPKQVVITFRITKAQLRVLEDYAKTLDTLDGGQASKDAAARKIVVTFLEGFGKK